MSSIAETSTSPSKVTNTPRRLIAVVTGSNQGIGREIVRGLSRDHPHIHVIATARNYKNAEQLEADLLEEGLPISIAQLDITDSASVTRFTELILHQYHGFVDILINNAGIAFKGDTFGAAEAETTIKTNYHGTKMITEALLPFLRKSATEARNSEGAYERDREGLFAGTKTGSSSSSSSSSVASSHTTTAVPDDSSSSSTSSSTVTPSSSIFYPRIINICSQAGKLSQLSVPLQTRFQHPALTTNDIDTLVNEFITSIADQTYATKGWSHSMYGVSKLAEIAYTNILARDLQKEGIIVNAVCPGYCSTSMSSYKGHKSAAEGADTPVWCATRHGAINELTGGFYYERKLIAW